MIFTGTVSDSDTWFVVIPLANSWVRRTPSWPADMQGTMYRCWDTLGTVAAVLSPLQDLMLVSLAAEMS